MARPQLGRGRRLSGREPRAPSRRRAAPARQRRGVSLLLHAGRARRATRSDAEARRRGVQVRPPLRPPRRRRDRAPRRGGRCRSSCASACPRATTSWDDLVHGAIAFPNKDIEDFIILRSDGTPIYNLAVVSRRHRDGASRSSCAATITSPTRRSRSCSTGARRAAAAVRAPADDPRARRQEAEQAPRRDRGRRLSAPRHPARRDAQLPRAARLVAGQRHRGDDGAADDRAVRRRRASEEGGDLRHEEARVDERPAPQPACPRDELAPLRRRPRIEAAGLATRGRARRRDATGSSRCSICSRCARARSTTSCARRRRTSATTIALRCRTRSRSSGRIARRRPTLLAAMRDALAGRRTWEPTAHGGGAARARRAARRRREGGEDLSAAARRAHRARA